MKKCEYYLVNDFITRPVCLIHLDSTCQCNGDKNECEYCKPTYLTIKIKEEQ